MTILEKLTSLGFENCELAGEPVNGVSTVRIRTDKGWTHQKFSSVDQIEAWSRNHKPEE